MVVCASGFELAELGEKTMPCAGEESKDRVAFFLETLHASVNGSRDIIAISTTFRLIFARKDGRRNVGADHHDLLVEKSLRDCFAKFDANGDGKIQESEFKRLMSSLGGFSSKEIKRLFKEADTDGSGSVDWREFLSWIINGTALKGMGAKGAASFERLLNTETQDEASFVESAQMGHNVTEYLKKSGSKGKSRTRKKTTTKAGCDEFGVPADHSGHRIQWPMTPQGAKELLDHFLHNGSRKPLHARHVQLILDEFVASYKSRHPKPVIETEVPQPDGRLVIVGDTHGQLADVLHILYHLGPPSAQNRYLFNGDMVDRGSQGVEILLILFTFFLADNESIIIHRGNHENEDMNALHADNGGGFEDEVMEKYGLSVYRHFINAFKTLSLASVINKEIFVVHGGLTRVKNLTVDYINTLPFQDYTAPHPMSTNVKEQLFSDLLWSDPTEYEGKYKSQRYGSRYRNSAAAALSAAALPIGRKGDAAEQEELQRLRFRGVALLFGVVASVPVDAALQRLKHGHAAVLGIGGVGSWVVESLARSGIGGLTLIDLDEICISNTNRQLHTLADTVGRAKVDVMAERVRQDGHLLINPDCKVETADPTMFCADDITRVHGDGLTRRVRSTWGIPVVYSPETPKFVADELSNEGWDAWKRLTHAKAGAQGFTLAACAAKSDRGVGIKYGPDVTTKFCSQNRLRFLVRSHQVPEDGRGFQKQHNDRCVTVFSASNYCGDGGNFGAVIVLSAANFPRYEVFEHFAAPLEELPAIVAQGDATDWNQMSTSQQRDSVETSRAARQEKTFERMIISIIEKKPQLWAYIIRNSLGQKLKAEDFVHMMEQQTDGDHPWTEAIEAWKVVDANGDIEVTKFLNRWVVKSESAGYSSFVNDAIKQVYEAIVAMDMDLSETFKMFDTDGDGTVDLKEAKQVLEKFDLGLSSSQIDRLLGQLFSSSSVITTADKAARMSIQDFLGHFTMVYSATNNADLPKWVLDTLGQIGRLIVKVKAPGAPDSTPHGASAASEMSKLFTEIDTSGDGILQLDEFVTGIEKLPGLEKCTVDSGPLTHAKLVEISKILDVTGDGTLNYLEFQQAFQLKGQGTTDLENSLVEDLTTLLFRYRVHIRTGCQFLDEVDSCKVLSEEFGNVLRGVNNALRSNEQGISESQIKHLSSALAVEEEDGQIVAYDDFLRSFVIVDTETKEVIKSFRA
eukprot:s528_g25.t2